jgi:hypothetical protein
MRLTRVVGLVFVSVLTVVVLQAVVAAYGGEDASPVVETSRVFIEPRTLSLEEGDTFTVSVMVENAQDMVGYAFKVDWNSSVLTVTEVVDAGFLLESPLTSLNESAGTLRWEALVLPNPTPPAYEDGADGDGALAVLTLRVVGSGISKLHLDSTKVEWLDADQDLHTPVFFGDGMVVVGGGFLYLPLVVRG